jgi:hypothetical protein
MQTAHPPVDVHAIQRAIHRLALSLDAVLVNGLQYGVLQPVGGEGFLRKTIDTLMADLVRLEGLVGTSAAPLRMHVEELTGMATALSPFRTWPLPLVEASVGRIRQQREACMLHIQQLETGLGVPNHYHLSRPTQAAAAVEAFLAQLDDAFVREWSAAEGQR